MKAGIIMLDIQNDSLIGEMMFRITQNGVNRLDIEMSGKLNSEEMKTALDELTVTDADTKRRAAKFNVSDLKHTK